MLRIYDWHLLVLTWCFIGYDIFGKPLLMNHHWMRFSLNSPLTDLQDVCLKGFIFCWCQEKSKQNDHFFGPSICMLRTSPRDQTEWLVGKHIKKWALFVKHCTFQSLLLLQRKISFLKKFKQFSSPNLSPECDTIARICRCSRVWQFSGRFLKAGCFCLERGKPAS